MRNFIAVILLLPASAFGQQVPNLAREWTSLEIVLSISLLIFTLVLIGIEALIIVKAKKSWTPNSITKLLGLTLLVSIAVLLVIAGYDQDQIAPVTGLLGVIAGYLLGNGDPQTSNKSSRPDA